MGLVASTSKVRGYPRFYSYFLTELLSDCHGLTHSGGVGSMKGRGDEVIAMITSMVDEFDKKSTSVEDSAMKEQVAKLQDKLEAVQNRNEKLMQEKSDLLDRQSSMLQTSAASSAKTYELQHEVEMLRRERDNGQAKLADLLNSVETLQRQAQSGGQDRSRIAELESDLSRAQNDKRTLEQTVAELRDRVSAEDEKWSNRMSEQRVLADAANNTLQEANRKINALSSELNETKELLSRAESAASGSSGVSEDEVSERVGAAVREVEQRLEQKVQLISETGYLYDPLFNAYCGILLMYGSRHE